MRLSEVLDCHLGKMLQPYLLHDEWAATEDYCEICSCEENLMPTKNTECQEMDRECT